MSHRRMERIGSATLYLGDAREILPTIGRFDAIVTDPPYGIGYQHSGGGSPTGLHNEAKETRPESRTSTIHGDAAPFDPGLILASSKPVLAWGANHFAASLPAGGSWLAWDKNVGIGPRDSFVDAEFAWCSLAGIKRNVYRHLWKGVIGEGADRTRAGQPRQHLSQKPRELMRWCLDHFRLRAGRGVVLDPYAGSGSTGVAAAALGLGFIGIEIEDAHFDTACRRVEQALRDGGGL